MKTTNESDVNWSERARKLLLANIANLGKKVLAGSPLSGAEIRVLEKAQIELQPAETSEPDSRFAYTQSGLARLLGVTRQCLQKHVHRPEAPKALDDGRHDVAAWVEYFRAYGRKDVAAPGIMPSDTPMGDGRPKVCFDFGDGLSTGLERIGDNLPDNLRKALTAAGITFTPRKADAAAVFLFLCMSSHINTVLVAHGFPSVFEPFADGTPFWAEGIAEAAKRARY